jgi:SAM-dependent methyltransferase
MDLGCGDGRVTELMASVVEADWSLVGVDTDPQEVALAEQSGFYDVVSRSDGAQLEYPNASLDFVISNSVLEHVDDLEALLREVGRVLRSGGMFVFTVPSEYFRMNLGRPGRFARWVTRASNVPEYLRQIDRRLAHRRYLSADEWGHVLKDAGMEMNEASYYMSPEETRRWAALSNATAGVLTRLVGRSQSPIEIQRRIGARGGAPLWIRLVGRAVGEVGAIALNHGNTLGPQSCLLVVAKRQDCRP